MKTDARTLGKLFLSTLYLSAFTFGGGYVIVTLMKKKFVDDYHWFDEKEMLDLVAIAQSAPGPIAVNGAIVTGYKIAGIAGILLAVLATVLPPFVILSVISLFYTAFRENAVVQTVLTGMQPAVAAIIADVVFEMVTGLVKEKSKLSIVVMVAAFAASFFWNINAVYIILICCILGIVRTVAAEKRRRKP